MKHWLLLGVRALLLGAFWLVSGPVMAKTYVVDEKDSQVNFVGTHAGKPFEGKFGSWRADIEFDADNLEGASILATFFLDEAKTGNKMFDGALPQADWFDVKNHPEAIFESHSITHKGGRVYTATGEFTLKGVTQPLAFDFEIEDLSAVPLVARAEFPIDRLAYNIGVKSDFKAEWVSQIIEIMLNISATPQK